MARRKLPKRGKMAASNAADMVKKLVVGAVALWAINRMVAYSQAAKHEQLMAAQYGENWRAKVIEEWQPTGLSSLFW